MRTFSDADGQAWQAALLDGSYGNVLLIFSPSQGQDTRHWLMDAENMAEAMDQLAAFDDDKLRGLLAAAEPWQPGL